MLNSMLDYMINSTCYYQGSVHYDSSIERYDEDRRMLAFFDSLLRRELTTDHRKSDSDDDDDDEDDDDSDG